MTDFRKLCTPAKLYLFLAIVAIIIGLLQGVSGKAVFWKIIFTLIWTCFLGWLCDKGYKSVSWFLVLLPYVIGLLILFLFISSTSSIKKNNQKK
jgi:hypothetical protein